MKINLAKALKLKNILVSEINVLWDRIIKNNSTLVDNKFQYNSTELFVELEEKKSRLLTLKEKITLANQPILSKIFQLSELKDSITKYSKIDNKDGVVLSYGGDTASYKTQLNKVEIDSMIEDCKNKINNLQDELDAFNATNTIEIPDNW